MTELDEKLKKDFENLPVDFWDFKNATTRELTHGLHDYPATMVYPISQNILKIVKKHIAVNSLMDPFMGSGTVLVEGMLSNIPELYGTDLNPLAVLISKVKTTRLNKNQLDYIVHTHKEYLFSISDSVNKLADDFDNFIRTYHKLDITEKSNWGSTADKYIKMYFNNDDHNIDFHLFKNLGFWFTPRVIILLQTIKNIILTVEDVDVKNFLLVAFSATVRNVSNTRNSEFKLFRMQPEKVAIFKPDVLDIYIKTLDKNALKILEFSKTCNHNVKVHVNLDDARQLKTIPDDNIDLIITSPPYGDSKTTVAYGQFSRLSLQWLGLENTTLQNVVNIDKNLLGGKPYNYKNQWPFLGSSTLVKTLNKIAEKDLIRANEVFSFYVDLDKSLYSISKKMKPNSYQFWVVGNRTVKLEVIQTDKIVIEMALKYGLIHLFSFDRNISNKVMPLLNSPTNKKGSLVKTMTAETIVVLKKE